MRVKSQKINIGRNKTFILIGVTILIILVLSIIYMNKQVDESVALIVDGKKYSKLEVERYINYGRDNGLDREQAISGATETIKFLAAANSLNITVDPSKVEQRYNELKKAHSKSDYDNYLRLLAQKQLITESMEQAEAQKGYYYEFYYGQHIQTGPGDITTGVGDKNLIQKDKDYAKQKAEYFLKLLKNQKVPAGTVYNMIQQEKQKDLNNASVYKNTKSFGNNPAKTWQDELQNQDIVFAIYKTKDISDLSVRESSINIGPASPKTDVAYYIIAKTSGNIKTNPNQFFDTLYNIKVERKI